MRSPFNGEKFISRRNFWVKQAPSAEVIYNYAVHTQRSTADSKEPNTEILSLVALQVTAGKHKSVISQAHS